MKHLFTMRLTALLLAIILGGVCMDIEAKKKKDKGDEDNSKVITARVWFKDGTVYEGQLAKHWRTRRQTFLDQGHNFHTVPADGSANTVKHETRETDSILILSSTHEDFAPGDFYMAYNGEGRYGLHKMLRRYRQGRHADIYTLLYWDTGGTKSQIQLMEMYYLLLHDNPSEIYILYNKALQGGQRKSKVHLKDLSKSLNKTGPAGLAEALTQKFQPDKKTSKESEAIIKENPGVLLEFIDDYLDSRGK